MPDTTGSNWRKDGTCMEAKYRTFVTLQQMIDFALIGKFAFVNTILTKIILDGLTPSEDPLLPSSIEAMCDAGLVTLYNLYLFNIDNFRYMATKLCFIQINTHPTWTYSTY